MKNEINPIAALYAHTSRDFCRHTLMRAYCDETRAWATDGHRLLVLQRSEFDALKKLKPGPHVYFGGSKPTGLAPDPDECKGPDIDSVIPGSRRVLGQIDATALLGLEAALARKADAQLRISKDSCTVRITTRLSKFSRTEHVDLGFDCWRANAGDSFGVNVRYLADAIRAVGCSGWVVIETDKAKHKDDRGPLTSPLVVHGGDHIAAVMPMRI